MRKLLTYSVAALVALTGAPRTAHAQVYPERVKIAVRHAVEEYQRRDREENREEQTERFTKTVRLGANGSLDVGNIAGDITVTRGGGTDATIEVIKTARGRTVDDAKEQLKMVQVDINERAGRAEVKVRYPHSDENWRGRGRQNLNVSVAYNITAPAGTQLAISTISGDVKITDIKGEIATSSVSGDVRISGASRITSAKSVSGSVDISDTQSDSGLEAGSVSGDVILRKVTARRLDLSSVSGNLQVENSQCERVSAHTVSGTVGFAGAFAKGGRYELKSFSGDVKVAVTGGAGFEVEASSFSGEVRPEMDIVVTNAGDSRRRQTTLSGTYGDGSAVLQITTFSGRIVIGKR
jgi:hypothetical protein